MRNKRKYKYKPRKSTSRRKKTDWTLWLNIIQTAIAIYHVLFD